MKDTDNFAKLANFSFVQDGAGMLTIEAKALTGIAAGLLFKVMRGGKAIKRGSMFLPGNADEPYSFSTHLALGSGRNEVVFELSAGSGPAAISKVVFE